MLDIFGNLRLLLKRREVVIDNTIFRLHWMFTGSLLVVFSIIITARQYVGEPINCFGVSHAPLSLLNTYCWVHATFTIEQAFGRKVGYDIPHPGIDNSQSGNKKYYPYYQWVCFVLFLQAMFFYVPHYIWKVWEGGLLQSITVGLTLPILAEEERKKRVNLLTDYLKRTTSCHKLYTIKYFICEVLCLVNVLGQMFLLDRFFDGEFWRYGTEVVRFSQANQVDRVDPMVYVFPRMTKCTFYSFGFSGDVQKHDTLCILPLNVVNEKIFIFLWFWFVILCFITVGVLLHRVVVIFCPPLRRYFLHDKCKLAREDQLAELIKDADVGDWFVVYMLGKNLDSLVFKDVVQTLSNNKIRNRTRKAKKAEAESQHSEEERESLPV